MKWVTKNYKGEKVVWYSEDVIKKIVEFINDFCNMCPYSESEEDICNNGCLLDEITQPICKIIENESEDL